MINNTTKMEMEKDYDNIMEKIGTDVFDAYRLRPY